MLSIIAVVIDNLQVTQRYISSVRQYTTGKYELILIDNGSTDNNAIEFIKKSADLHFRFDERTDLAKAWNKGIQLSKGDHLAVVNNDVVVPPNWYPPLKEVLESDEKVGMVSPITFWLIKSHYYQYGGYKGFDDAFRKPFKLLKFKEVVWGEFFVFKRKALEDVGYYCELYEGFSGEDLEMCFQLYSKGYDIYVDPRVFVYHEGKASQIPSIVDEKEVKERYRKNFELFKSRWPEYTRGWT